MIGAGRAVAVALACAVVALTQPVLASDDAPCRTTAEVELCVEHVWFTDAETRLGNLGWADSPPTWSTDEPTASVTEGAGGAHGSVGIREDATVPAMFRLALDLTGNGHREVEATFEGHLHGALDVLTVEMYHYDPLEPDTVALAPRIEVYGVGLYDAERVDVPVEDMGDGLRRIRLAVTDLLAPWQELGLPSDPDLRHPVTVRLATRSLADTPVMVWGATEFPSAMTTNTLDLDGYAVLSAGEIRVR